MALAVLEAATHFREPDRGARLRSDSRRVEERGLSARAARLAALTLLLALIAADATPSGRVVGVVDGDTLTLRTGAGEQVRIRIFGIDAPEREQPYSAEALDLLADLAARKTVEYEQVDIDRYGRTVAWVRVGDTDLGSEMVRRGAAWVYRKYTDDPGLIALEREARAAKRGLWSLAAAERVPPWTFRKRARGARAAEDESASKFSCGQKTYCREMTSCAEARFYLEKCGLTRLDGDGDGVPCASLCR